jgi:transposase
LKSHDEVVREYLDKTPPSTIKQACQEIGELTGIYRKPTQMRKYLKSLGASPKKVCGIPAKADIEKQEKFKTEELEPRLEEAKAGKRDVYFVDAAHFVLGAFLGMLWCITRVFVRTPSGRQRFNVLGALNAVTHQLVTVTNTTYITSVQVGELLRQLAKDATKPITLVLDNARYQRCQYVMALAEELGIELLFLPSYSPNLNLIERLWKLVKKECLYSRYHQDFQQFQNTISDFLDNMRERNAPELDSLLRLNFQTFTEEQFRKAP